MAVTSGRASAPTRRWDGPVLACAGALLVVALFRRLVPADSDTPWHLAEGRLLLRRWADGEWDIGSLDSFSWTARGSSWHPNSWAFDALMAGIHDVAGWSGLALLRLALLASTVAVAWAYSRRSGAGRWARAGAVWISVVLVIPTGALRPQLASFVLLLVCLVLTSRLLRGPSPSLRWLLVLAATFSVWSMLHGAVLAGVAAVAAACAGHAVDTRRWRWPALTAFVALAASCLSPLGIRVWTYAIRTGGESRRQGIEEWQPPSLQRADDVAIVVFLLAIVAWAGWRMWRDGPDPSGGRSWALLAPALVSTALTFLAARNATFAVVAAVPLLAALLGAAGQWLDRRGWAPPVRPGLALGAMTAGGLLAGVIQTGGLALDPDPLGDDAYPAAAARTLPGGCRILNEYHFGGYLILARPDIPVSQDGRNDLYGTRRLAEQEDLFTEVAPSGATAALDRAGISCVLAEPSRELNRALAGDPRWRRLAADATAQAWTRSP